MFQQLKLIAALKNLSKHFLNQARSKSCVQKADNVGLKFLKHKYILVLSKVKEIVQHLNLMIFLVLRKQYFHSLQEKYSYSLSLHLKSLWKHHLVDFHYDKLMAIA